MREINRALTFDIIFYCIVSLFFTFIFYFLFLQSDVLHYKTAKKNYGAAVFALQQRKQLAVTDIQTQNKLYIWKQQHPNFYQLVKSHPTVDQLSQLATNIAEKSGFSVTQVTPVIVQKNNNPLKTVGVHIQLSGAYQNLFYFVDQLNQTAWPYALTQLRIPNANQFNIRLSVGNL